MATTPEYGIRYPSGGDDVDIATSLQNLALDVEGAMNDNLVPATGGTLTGDLTISKASAVMRVAATSGAPSLNIDTPAAAYDAYLNFRTGTSPRWSWSKSSTEAGANSGSNLNLYAYNDAGSLLSTPLSIVRSTGAATFTGDVTVSKVSAALRVASSSGDAVVKVDRPAGLDGAFKFRTGSVDRWWFGCDSTAEGGSDAGSNLYVRRLSDGGAHLSYPLVVLRGSGKVRLGDVGASAGLEYGASGPRDMVGTGSPEGVVTAPVGSTWRDTNATTGAIRWIKASGSGNTGWTLDPNVIPVAVGSSVDLTGPYFTSSGGAPTNIGDLFMSPVYVPCAMTISRIDLRVSGGAGAGATWRLGFWKLDGTGGTPNTLIADLGTLDPTTTGVKAITGLSTVLPAGRVAFGFALQGTGTGGGYTYAAPPRTITDTGSGTRYIASHTGWLATAVTGAFGATQSNNPASLGFCTPHLVVERSA